MCAFLLFPLFSAASWPHLASSPLANMLWKRTQTLRGCIIGRIRLFNPNLFMTCLNNKGSAFTEHDGPDERLPLRSSALHPFIFRALIESWISQISYQPLAVLRCLLEKAIGSYVEQLLTHLLLLSDGKWPLRQRVWSPCHPSSSVLCSNTCLFNLFLGASC